jgi:hypothetical protein
MIGLKRSINYYVSNIIINKTIIPMIMTKLFINNFEKVLKQKNSFGDCGYEIVQKIKGPIKLGCNNRNKECNGIPFRMS